MLLFTGQPPGGGWMIYSVYLARRRMDFEQGGGGDERERPVVNNKQKHQNKELKMKHDSMNDMSTVL
jgi:hypothetical protein